MDMSLTMTMVFKLLFSLSLGGLIGLEREFNKHPAGLRTHILVALGSTTFMLLGYHSTQNIGDPGSSIDPTRMAAGIVTGIGFLGAGAIMKEGVNVRGLTTAASIWVVASVGISVAAELYIPAVVTTILSLVVLLTFSRAEMRMGTKEVHGSILIKGDSFKGLPGAVANTFEEHMVGIDSMDLKREAGHVVLKYHVHLPRGLTIQKLIHILSKEKKITHIEWIA